MFATILYGFAFGRDTLRDLEDACEYDLRFIYLMEQTKVDHSTFCTFINKVIVPYEKEIFALINIQIKKELNIEFEDAFIDGSKFEANANKYKFVWKPITFHERISKTFFELLKEKDYNKITVTDIVNKADLNRSTFYAHYLDVRTITEEFENEELFHML